MSFALPSVNFSYEGLWFPPDMSPKFFLFNRNGLPNDYWVCGFYMIPITSGNGKMLTVSGGNMSKTPWYISDIGNYTHFDMFNRIYDLISIDRYIHIDKDQHMLYLNEHVISEIQQKIVMEKLRS